MNHKRQRLYVLGALVAIIVVSLKMTFFMPIYLYVSGMNELIFLFDIWLFGCLNAFRLFYSAQFVLACSAVRKRFEASNEYLGGGKLKPGLKIVSPRTFVNVKFQGSYLRLCDALDIINENFTLHLIPLITILLVSCVMFS